MDTVEYSQHVARIGKNIRRIAENVESAADNEFDGAEREDAIAKARARLTDFDDIAAKLSAASKTRASQFVERFEDDIDLIRESLERVDAESGAGNDQ
jgi:hypothetical protein